MKCWARQNQRENGYISGLSCKIGDFSSLKSKERFTGGGVLVLLETVFWVFFNLVLKTLSSAGTFE